MNNQLLPLLNQRNQMNGLHLLDLLDESSVKVVFFDPQYRGILDKMSYGNEGKNRGKERSSLPQMSEETIKDFLAKIERILKPNGYLFLWIDKFHLMEGVKKWFENFKTLEIVNTITWDKKKWEWGIAHTVEVNIALWCKKNHDKQKALGFCTISPMYGKKNLFVKSTLILNLLSYKSNLYLLLAKKMI